MSYKLGGVSDLHLDEVKRLEDAYYTSSIPRETFIRELLRLGYDDIEAKDDADEIDNLRKSD